MDQSLYLGKVWHDWCYSDKSTNIEGIYFYAHQACFLDDLFSIIPKLPITINIYILDSTIGMSGCIGFNSIKKRLITKYGVLETNIIPIPFLDSTSCMVNTLNESISIIKYFKTNAIKNILIASPFFHIPRAFLTILSVSFNLNYNIKIYCAPSVPSGHIKDWYSKIYTHHQGIFNGTISELFKSELNRIERYHKKGDLVSIESAIKYLELRDT
jgi:hypothetical protein